MLLALTTVGAVQANAAPVLTYSNTDFNNAPAVFSFGNGVATYTLSNSGDLFNPATITTGGGALVNTFGGFLGIPVAPTVNFLDRGTVVYSTSQSYGAFPTATVIPYSNGGNFLGLKFSLADGDHVGFAEFVDDVLVGYGFESTPGASITATEIPAPVPEPGAFAVLGAGLIGLGFIRRNRLG